MIAKLSEWRWPLIWVGVFTALGLLNAEHFYLDSVARGHPASLLPKLIEELTGSWSVGLLLPLVITGIRRTRHLSDKLRLWLYRLGMLFGFSALHTSLMWGSRLLTFPLFGLRHYDYGAMPWRYIMEFPSDVIVYALIVSLTWLVDHYRADRARELRVAQLESALADARLDALRLQLNPHFLFNALNAVSSIMYEQPRTADEMLARIGGLLRATLGTEAQVHTMSAELHLLKLYLDIQRARFGERLKVSVDIPSELSAVCVPFLLLQPLVENAIEHAGGGSGATRGNWSNGAGWSYRASCTRSWRQARQRPSSWPRHWPGQYPIAASASVW